MSQQTPSPAFVALVQATAGAAAGVIAAFTLMPLEVVKTRIQVSKSKDISTLGTFNEILEVDGVSGLYRGVFAKCTETGTKNFVYFYIYDSISTAMKSYSKLTTVVKMAIGYIAGVGNTTLTMPLEVLATRLQMKSVDGQGLVALCKAIIEKEGVRGLFKGYAFNILLCVNPAIQNTCFDRLKDTILQLKAKQLKSQGISYSYKTYPSLTPLQAFMLGAFSKAVATCITFPLTRVKTILQTGSVAAEQGKPETGGKGSFETLGTLYSGIGSALTKSVLQGALLYMSKDQIEKLVLFLFRASTKLLRRRSGQLKLGVTSGRALAS